MASDMARYLAAGELDAAVCLFAGELPDGRAAERLSEDEVAAAIAAAGETLQIAWESGDRFLLRALAGRGFATAIIPRSLTAADSLWAEEDSNLRLPDYERPEKCARTLQSGPVRPIRPARDR